MIAPQPLRGEKLGMCDGMEQVHIQPFVPGGPIETLNVRVLRRLTRLDIQHRDPVLVGPG